MRNHKFLLVLIFLLGVFLRFWQLPSRPVSLSIDEVAIGYNAYSLLKTGRDEWGEHLPLAFRSVGDYKAPLLVYLTVPSVAVFGLTEFGTRFPIALIGSLTVIVVYFFIKELTKNQKISIFTALSIAISPWHIQYSRMTHESILGLFWFILGLWFFIANPTKARRYCFPAIFFALSLYTYHTHRLHTPIFVLGLVIIFAREIFTRKNIRALLFTILLSVVLCLPFLGLMRGAKGQARISSVFLSKDVDINYQLHKDDEKLNLFQKIFDNNTLTIFNFWTKRYLEYFDIPYLFFKGMKLAVNQSPGVGLFHLFELPFFLAGLWVIIVKRKHLDSKAYRLFLIMVFLGPLAASLANNEQHPPRSLVLIPSLQLLVGAGGYYFWEKARKFGLFQKLFSFTFFIFILGISLVYYLDLYHFHYPINFSEYWSYGMKEAALFAWDHQKEYNNIVIDSSFGTQGPFTVSTPHLYVYFYGKYDPWLLQTDPLHDKWPGKGSADFLNFSFRPIYWPTDRFSKNTLFIGSPWGLPKDELSQAKVLKEIRFLNGSPALLIVETQR